MLSAQANCLRARHLFSTTLGVAESRRIEQVIFSEPFRNRSCPPFNYSHAAGKTLGRLTRPPLILNSRLDLERTRLDSHAGTIGLNLSGALTLHIKGALGNYGGRSVALESQEI